MWPTRGRSRRRVGGFVLLGVLLLIAPAGRLALLLAQRTSPGWMAAETILPEAASPQVATGRAVYIHACARCHGPLGGKGTTAPHLIGEEMAARLETFQTAAALFTFTRFAMPQDKPGSLLEDEYWAVLAFVLASNGFPLGDDGALGPATAAGVMLKRER